MDHDNRLIGVSRVGGTGGYGRAGKADNRHRLCELIMRLHPADAGFRRQEAHGPCLYEE